MYPLDKKYHTVIEIALISIMIIQHAAEMHAFCSEKNHHVLNFLNVVILFFFFNLNQRILLIFRDATYRIIDSK